MEAVGMRGERSAAAIARVVLPCTIVRHHALSDRNMTRQKGCKPARSHSIIQLISHTFPSDPKVARSL
jgi:hypothetical protein